MFRSSIILKNAREDKSLDISEVSKKLKISTKYLEAIENEDKNNFPAEPYCSLIIKDYANFLGLNGEDILSLFRRDFAAPCKQKPTTLHQMSLTPQNTFKFATLISIILFFSYLVFEYIKFNRPPTLKVNWPEKSSNTLDLSGITDSEATVRINNDLIVVDPSGSFKKTINLATPEAKIVVESKSQSGKTTTVEKTYK